MAGLGIHGGDHPVLGDPSCEAIGPGRLVDELDVLASDDPEEAKGSELGGIEGALGRLVLVVSEVAKGACALDQRVGIAYNKRQGRIDELLVVVVNGGLCPCVVDLVCKGHRGELADELPHPLHLSDDLGHGVFR